GGIAVPAGGHQHRTGPLINSLHHACPRSTRRREPVPLRPPAESIEGPNRAPARSGVVVGEVVGHVSERAGGASVVVEAVAAQWADVASGGEAVEDGTELAAKSSTLELSPVSIRSRTSKARLRASARARRVPSAHASGYSARRFDRARSSRSGPVSG